MVKWWFSKAEIRVEEETGMMVEIDIYNKFDDSL